ncbi:MAG: hypothetical protein ACLVJO_02205 [[Clostridium] scindens]
MNAEDAGVKFISYDSDIEGTSGFIGIDNYEYGYAIGKNAATGSTRILKSLIPSKWACATIQIIHSW